MCMGGWAEAVSFPCTSQMMLPVPNTHRLRGGEDGESDFGVRWSPRVGQLR